MKLVHWNRDAEPVGTSFAHVLYDVRRDDHEGLLLDSITEADIIEDSDGTLTLDALVSLFSQIERRMGILRRLMDRSATSVKVVEDTDEAKGMTITAPFKKLGRANVAAIFQLTDGQTVTIFFHNPDTTPAKLAPTDELVSWKWQLNKKDVTIVVAPEKGKDLNVHEVARRIMKLAEKNSEAFKRANARKAERMKQIEEQKAEITKLEGELKTAENGLKEAEIEYEDLMAKKIETEKALKEFTAKRESEKTEVTEEPEVSEESDAPQETEDEEKSSSDDKAAFKLSELLKWGNYWEKEFVRGTYRRTYFDSDVFLEKLGFKLYTTKNGRKHWSAPDGDAVSTTKYSRLLGALERMFYDHDKRAFFNGRTEIDLNDLFSYWDIKFEDDLIGQDSTAIHKNEEEKSPVEEAVDESLLSYPMKQVFVSELIKGGSLWDKGEGDSRIYPSRANLLKLSGFRLQLSASRKNIHGAFGPDGKRLPDSVADAIWIRIKNAYWDNVKKKFSDSKLLSMLRLELVDDMTGTDKDIQAGTVGLYSDLIFPDVHVPIPEGFVPVMTPSKAAEQRKTAKNKREKPPFSYITVEKETDKSYKIGFIVPEGHFDGNEESHDATLWVPKEHCVVDGDTVVAMTEILAKEHGFPYSKKPVTVVPRDPKKWAYWPLKTPKDIIEFTEKLDSWSDPKAERSGKANKLEDVLVKNWPTFSGKDENGRWFTVSSKDGDWVFQNTDHDEKSPYPFLDLVIQYFKMAYENGSLTNGQSPASTEEKNQDGTRGEDAFSAEREMLTQIIEGTYPNIAEPETMDKLLAIIEPIQKSGDKDLNELLEKAAEAATQAAMRSTDHLANGK